MTQWVCPWMVDSKLLMERSWKVYWLGPILTCFANSRHKCCSHHYQRTAMGARLRRAGI